MVYVYAALCDFCLYSFAFTICPSVLSVFFTFKVLIIILYFNYFILFYVFLSFSLSLSLSLFLSLFLFSSLFF